MPRRDCAGMARPATRGIREDNMSNRYPKGYWSSVFDQAAFLMNQRNSLSGETAYWLARRMVDRSLVGAGHSGPAFEGSAGQLVLSP